MIAALLRVMRWRVAVLLLAAVLFYIGDPGLHEHVEEVDDVAELLAPTGLSFTVANMAALSMVVLLAGFISADRRRGYYRLAFSHPTRPMAFYALRWGMALALSMGLATAFLVVSQLVAWGTMRVGFSFLLQGFLLAVAYGGIMAFCSALMPRGEGFVAVGLFFLTDLWLTLLAEAPTPPFAPATRALVSFILPPHTAVSDVYTGLLSGFVAWGGVAYAVGYGLFWLALAALLVRVREWP
ncbi:MAG TPA: hypothetical protein VE913_14010 [Longimicrobium sp.]|nr:hypothetical protein [Longimicrobium sp.]